MNEKEIDEAEALALGFEWSDHQGGDAPGDPSSLVHVRFRDGRKDYNAIGNFDWSRGGSADANDIVAVLFSHHNP